MIPPPTPSQFTEAPSEFPPEMLRSKVRRQFHLRDWLVLMACAAFPLGVHSSLEILPLTIAACVLAVGAFLSYWRPSVWPFVVSCGVVFGSGLFPTLGIPPEAARRMQCSSHLQRLGIAWHEHADANTTLLAPYSVDAKGKPLLSWRVHLLPALGEDALYRKFHLDEPWNSPHNASLIVEMPDVYRCPTDQPARDTFCTSYVAVVASETAWPPGGGLTLGSYADGTSNTVLLVEYPPSNIVWTEPRDLRLSDLQRLQQSPASKSEREHWHANRHDHGGHMLYADGSVRFCECETLTVQRLRALFTIAGGEKVDRSDE